MVETPNERRKRLQRERQQRYHDIEHSGSSRKRIRVSNNAANILTSSSLSSFVSTIENRPIPSLNPGPPVPILKAQVYPLRLTRHNLGNMDQRCRYCGALLWIDERKAGTSMRSPIFTTCCAEGKTILPSF
ncbi:hypothetical protein C2G38_2164207 [Gigaspora rosea]|uniref:Uncharacterized protein n=1 Tax=Gigaspora rosea TaxID=44941 RepID=A0A397VU58_9GLOM|nr:hypothetical protein C2G38_2164207 [Gigaspora rosea]